VPDEKTTKDQRRDAAREAARLQREKQKRRDARTKIFVRGGATLAILAVAAVVTIVIVNANAPAGPGPLNMASDGIVLTGTTDGLAAVKTKAVPADGKPIPTDTSKLDSVVHIVTYVDLLCPFCQQFEATNGAQIQTLVEGGFASLEVHPIAILDSSSLGTKYSTRAANATACVANYKPESYLEVLAALYADGTQPTEGTKGLTDDELAAVVAKAGVTDKKVATCIKDETFDGWVSAATKRALADKSLENSQGGFGTPTVLVNGARYEGSLTDASAFSAFVAQQYTAAGGADPNATPTPTPTPAG
jgi:protein-disulfide isomerase